MSSSQLFFKKVSKILAKAKNGHVNIWELFKLNILTTYNFRSPKKDSEKNMVSCKKGDDITGI
jgi:hypothetical protein